MWFWSDLIIIQQLAIFPYCIVVVNPVICLTGTKLTSPDCLFVNVSEDEITVCDPGTSGDHERLTLPVTYTPHAHWYELQGANII